MSINMTDQELKDLLSIETENQMSVIEKYEQIVQEKYLKQKSYFRTSTNATQLYEYYSNLFKYLIFPNNIIEHLNGKSVFEYFTDVIQNSDKEIPLVVKSKAGHGKTEFLSVLYQYLLDKYYSNLYDKYPLYVSLHYYNKFEYPNPERMQKQAKELLGSDIAPILTYIQDDSKINKILLIVDGPDEYRYAKVKLETILMQNIDQYTLENVQIIGLRQHEDAHQVNYRDSNIRTYDSELEITIENISIDSPNYVPIVEYFSKIEMCMNFVTNAKKLQEYILRISKKLSIRYIDLFHLYLLSLSYQNRSKYTNLRNLGELYERYINHRAIDLDEISKLAYKMYHTPSKVLIMEKNTRTWWKLQKHKSLCNFFAAYYIANKLIKSTEDNDTIYDYVYPYELNSFCKDIINEDNESQENAYETIIQLFENSSITARTHFCYLLGRFEDNAIRHKALTFLQNQEKAISEKIFNKIQNLETTNNCTKTDKQMLLLHRTICISLICLEDNDASQRYISQMLKNKPMDNINRGFHLEYYEDIISPLTTQTELLTHNDNLCDFPKTFQRLYNKLLTAVKNNFYYSLFDVELYTICSLTQHRLEKGKVINELDLIIDLIKLVIKSNVQRSPRLKEYLNLCLYNFNNKDSFRLGAFIKEIYALKDIERKGWTNRQILDSESIASHIWGTLILAYMYLPNSMSKYPEYDKNLIIRMLIIHDIAEVYIGDLTPQEKDEKAKLLEKICFNYIALMGTYDSINCIEIDDLFYEFTNSNDINCQIARDIDKLDNLMQLLIYHEKFQITDFMSFKNDLESKISTEIGKQIMININSSFVDKRTDVLSSLISELKTNYNI